MAEQFKSAVDIRHPNAVGERAQWTLTAWFLLLGASTAVLLGPAFYNGFPLIFPDTGAYLSVSYGHSWTVDRSGFYGLLYKSILVSAEPAAGLWMVLVLQAALIATVILMIVRRVVPAMSPLGTFALIAATALLSALPWHAAQLMPDAFTGPLVLLVWLAMSRDPSAPGIPLVWLGVVVLGLMHYTHLGLIAVVVVTSLVVLVAFKAPFAQVGKRLIAAAIAISAVVTAHVAANGFLFDRWSVSPMGPLFLFARLHEDGLTDPWFNRHCRRDAPRPLCEINPRLPRDSQVLLWGGPASPLNAVINDKVGEQGSWTWIDMLDQAAIGSIRERPAAFAGNSVKATASQFVHFAALDDECPEKCAVTDLIAFRPELAGDLASSRQRRGDMPKAGIRLLTSIVAWLSLALAVPLIEAARRKRDAIALSLLVAICAALVANAFMAGALSDVHDRYQSRLVWLVPFAALLLAARWQWLLLNRSSPMSRKRNSALGEAVPGRVRH